MYAPSPFEVIETLPGARACAQRGDDIDIIVLADVADVRRGDFLLVNEGIALAKMSRAEAQSMQAALAPAG